MNLAALLACGPVSRSLRHRWSLAMCLGSLVFWLSACVSVPVVRMDLSQPGVVQRSGQAVWTPGRGAEELVVDLEVWTEAHGACALDVSKAGLPFLMAQVTSQDWRIDTSTGRRHAARGEPPARVGWLQLARALAGRTPASPWQFEQLPPFGWRLTHRRTGESFDGFLQP